jgi:GNAT superfamily N-acetyltransferase
MKPKQVPISVREAREEDHPVIVAFNHRLAVESEGKRLDDATLQAGVRRALSHPDLCRYFVAQVDGTVVGTTMVTVELTDWRDGVIWWLQSVYVTPELRRAGVFRALYAHISNLARRSPDVRGLRLYVHLDNARAMQTYEAVGMGRAGYELYESDWSNAVKDDTSE